MAMLTPENMKMDCRVFGADTVPWCATESINLLMVPDHLISSEKVGDLRIPLVMVNTGTPQKFQSFENSAKLIKRAKPGFRIDRIIWANDILPDGEESKFTHGQDVSEEKAIRWWSKYHEKKLQYVKDDGIFGCLTANKCWRFPRVVFTDVRVSWNGVGSSASREYLDNLKDELVTKFGVNMGREIADDEMLVKSYIFSRVTEHFALQEQAVIHLDPGMTALKFMPNAKTRTIRNNDYMLASGRMNFTYSLPASMFYSPDFWSDYFERISHHYGGYKALLATPMGLRFEHILAVAKDHCLLDSGHDLIARVPREGEEYNLSPAESLAIVAKGFHPALIYKLFSELESEEFISGKRIRISVGEDSRKSSSNFSSLIYQAPKDDMSGQGLRY